MMAMAIKPVKKKNKEQEPAFSLRALVTNDTSNLFYLLAKFKISKFENQVILKFFNRQKWELPEYYLLKIIRHISILSF